MPRRFYIFCEPDEREQEPVQALRGYLTRAGCEVDFAPVAGACEDRIEQCDVFIAALGRGYRTTTWLLHEAYYASMLSRIRMEPRPRLLGMWLTEERYEPFFLGDISGWIAGEETYPELFVDLPPRWQDRPSAGAFGA